jgi:nitrite reductase/ring-hydroxylating ferredoxin subunit
MTAGHARVPDPGGRVYRSQYQDDPYQGGQLQGTQDGYGWEDEPYEPPAWNTPSRRQRTLPSGRRVGRRPEPEPEERSWQRERPSWRDRISGDDGDGSGRRKLLIGGAVGGVLALAGERLLGLFGKALQSTASAGTGTQAGGTGQKGSVVLGSTADIPVGGGKIYTAHKVVVTQPTAGVFQGFSTTCTHAGCQVNQVQQGKILCPCHGGQFSVADGSVVGGPPPSALPAAAVAVQGTDVLLTS